MSVRYCHYHQDEEQEQCDPKRSFAHYPLSPPHSIAVTLANSHTNDDDDDYDHHHHHHDVITIMIIMIIIIIMVMIATS